MFRHDRTTHVAMASRFFTRSNLFDRSVSNPHNIRKVGSRIIQCVGKEQEVVQVIVFLDQAPRNNMLTRPSHLITWRDDDMLGPITSQQCSGHGE